MAACPAVPPRTELAARILAELRNYQDLFPEDARKAIPGAHALFDMDEFLAHMKPKGKYLGRATSIFQFRSGEDAIRGVAVSEHDVHDYRADRFAKLATGVHPEWECPVTVAVTPSDVSAWESYKAGADGHAPSFRRISMDAMVYAFLSEMWARLPWDGSPVDTAFWKAARHIPVDFVFFEDGPELEKQIYVAGLQIQEDFRKRGDAHAPRAWQLCKLWARARALQLDVPDDNITTATAAFLSKVEYSKSCDYVDKNGEVSPRMVADAMIVFDRVTAAGVGELLDKAGAEFGPRSPLGTMTKLIKLSQATQAAATSRKADLPPLFRRAVQVMYLRLHLNIVSRDESHSVLSKTELPRVILIAELWAFAIATAKAENEGTLAELTELLNHIPSQPSRSLEKVSSKAEKPSTVAMLAWAGKLLLGHFDTVLTEVVHQHLKTKSAEEILKHGKFEWDEVRSKIAAEAEADQRTKLAQQAAAACGSLGLVPHDDPCDDLVDALRVEMAAGEQRAERTSAPAVAAVEREPDEVEREHADDIARRAKANEIFHKYFRLVVRPEIDEAEGQWREVIRKTVDGFGGLTLDGISCHGWVFDPASDCEPKLVESEGLWAHFSQVDKALAERFFKAAGQISMADEGSFVTLCFSRVLPDPSVQRMVTGSPFEDLTVDNLNIIYKDQGKGRGQRKSRSSLLERAYCGVSKKAVDEILRANGKASSRPHHHATTAWADTIIQAVPRSADGHSQHVCLLPLARKVRILGSSNLLRGENVDDVAAAESQKFLLHQEKTVLLWKDILHHFHFSTLCTASPGSGDLLIAAFDLGVVSAALCKNQAHFDLLQERLLAWVADSLDDARSRHYAKNEGACSSPPSVVKSPSSEEEVGEEDEEEAGKEDEEELHQEDETADEQPLQKTKKEEGEKKDELAAGRTRSRAQKKQADANSSGGAPRPAERPGKAAKRKTLGGDAPKRLATKAGTNSAKSKGDPGTSRGALAAFRSQMGIDLASCGLAISSRGRGRAPSSRGPAISSQGRGRGRGRGRAPSVS